jgi:hypothetical protein
VIILKLKNIVKVGLYVTLVGITGAYADTTQTQVKADEPVAKAWSYKLTPSYYVTTHGIDASDINLRANNGAHALWLGHYQRGGEFEQTRTGYEYTAQMPFVQIVPSLQLATHGFAGGSINAQLGDETYVLLGWGYTNTRDYYNLNFDPNDSITYGIGTSKFPKSNILLFTVKDNRLQTGQIVTHAVWRLSPDEIQRWTVDLSSKTGRGSPVDDLVSGMALSVTYDYKEIFFRLAKDQNVNFTNEDQTRISIGMRF